MGREREERDKCKEGIRENEREREDAKRKVTMFNFSLKSSRPVMFFEPHLFFFSLPLFFRREEQTEREREVKGRKKERGRKKKLRKKEKNFLFCIFSSFSPLIFVFLILFFLLTCSLSTSHILLFSSSHFLLIFSFYFSQFSFFLHLQRGRSVGREEDATTSGCIFFAFRIK